jgi:hypothetical protein
MGDTSNTFNEEVQLGVQVRHAAQTLLQNPVENWPENQMREMAENSPQKLDRIDKMVTNQINNIDRAITGSSLPNGQGDTFPSLNQIDTVRSNFTDAGRTDEQIQNAVNQRADVIARNAKNPELAEIIQNYAGGNIDRQAAEQQLSETINSWKSDADQAFDSARNPESPAQEQELNNQNLDTDGLPTDPTEDNTTTPVPQAAPPTYSV